MPLLKGTLASKGPDVPESPQPKEKVESAEGDGISDANVRDSSHVNAISSEYNLIKSNVIRIDGTNLHRCCFTEIHPEPLTLIGCAPSKALTHSDTRLDHYSRYVRELIFRLFLLPNGPHRKHQAQNDTVQNLGISNAPPTMSDTIWAVVASVFKFQPENLYNQFEDVTHVLLTMCLREVVPLTGDLNILPQILGPQLVGAIVEEYHAKLFDNYLKWCDYMKIEGFPWHSRDGEDRGPAAVLDLVQFGGGYWGDEDDKWASVRQLVVEISLFKLLWGEAANLRHTPELLAFLFHWMVKAWAVHDVTGPIERGATILDIITIFCQRIRDEAFYGADRLKPPDHAQKLNYDDFNELFWESSPLTSAGLLFSGDEPLLLSKKNAHELLARVTRSDQPGKSVKTFVERRGYVQVARAFYRIFHFHTLLLRALFIFRAIWTKETQEDVNILLGRFTATGICLSGLAPVLELLLFDPKQLKKWKSWLSIFRRKCLHVLRLGFVIWLIGVLIINPQLDQPALHPITGSLGLSYLIFYMLHSLWPFLFVRCAGQMPLFAAIWYVPGLRWLLGPTTYTGGTALLAEDFSHVLCYALFWAIPFACKLIFWFFAVLPPVEQSYHFLGLVETRPILLFDVAIAADQNNATLRLLFWLPFYVLWLYDTQLFFLLWSALTSTFQGYIRRVGYVQDVETIQKRLLPLVPAAPLFRPTSQPNGAANGMAIESGNPSTTTQRRRGSLNSDLSMEGLKEPGALSQDQLAAGPQRTLSKQASDLKTPHGTPQTRSCAREKGVSYANNTDPYDGLVRASHEDGQDRCRKAFGFMWNEIIETWRMEDIINNAEQAKLQYCELPTFLSARPVPETQPENKTSTSVLGCRAASLGLYDWSELRDPRLMASWDRSVVRSPAYVYCNVIESFVYSCDNYQVLLKNDATALRSRQSMAQRFFRKHLSPAPGDVRDTGLRSKLPLDGLAEVYEALALYLARYFNSGSQLVLSLEAGWSWLAADPQRLANFDLRALRDLKTALTNLFAAAEAFDTTDTAYHTCHRALKAAFLKLCGGPMEPGEDLRADEVKAIIAAVEDCFAAPDTFRMSSYVPPPSLDFAEVDSLVLKIQQANRTDIAPGSATTCHLNCSVFAPYLYGSKAAITLKKEVVADLRTLYRLESGAFIPRDVDGVLRLYFRRAHSVLTAREGRLGTDEAARRMRFFVNSLLMKVPIPPAVAEMVSMTTLTPYYREACVADVEDMHRTTSEGVTKEELLRSLMPVEFDNFLERVDRYKENFNKMQSFVAKVDLHEIDPQRGLREMLLLEEARGTLFHYVRFTVELQQWLSMRSQVLARTAHGMMHFERALQILAFVEMTPTARLRLSHDKNRLSRKQQNALGLPEAGLWRAELCIPPPYMFSPSIKCLARLKYQYVIAAQEFAKDAKTPIPEVGKEPADLEALLRRNGVIRLLRQNPNLRIATLEEVVDLTTGKPTGQKASVLYKWAPQLYSAEPSRQTLRNANAPSAFPVEFSAGPTSGALSDWPSSESTSEARNGIPASAFSTYTSDTIQRMPAQKLSPIFQPDAVQMSSPPSNPNESSHLLSPSQFPPPQPSSSVASGASPWREEHSQMGSAANRSRDPSGLQRSSQRSSRRSAQRFKLSSPTPARFEPISIGQIPLNGINLLEEDETPLIGRDNDLLVEERDRNVHEAVSIHVAATHAAVPPMSLKRTLSTATSEGTFAASMAQPRPAILDGSLQVVLRIKLPFLVDEQGKPWGRNPVIGPGKPENQNHAMIFTRGETVQAVDMNMEGYLEEAYKLRNLLQEFTAHPRMRILGFREHVFSLNVSSISSYMALQELNFVTNNHRLYHQPLYVRMHYGHPDVFDRFFITTCGSASKSSAGVNLSEDVFAGYNATQRGFGVNYVDYIQLGKGRDVGLQQIFMFEKKVAGGNAEQMLSRDVRRLIDHSDFLRACSLFYTGCGFYLNCLVLMLAVLSGLYGRVLMSLSRQTSLTSIGAYWDRAIAPVTTFQLQLGLLLLFPIILVTCLEKGLGHGLKLFCTMILKFALFYYNFMSKPEVQDCSSYTKLPYLCCLAPSYTPPPRNLCSAAPHFFLLFAVCTKASTIDSVLVYGGARYEATGRGFAIEHSDLISLWRVYSFTHFQIGVEILMLLILYACYGGVNWTVYFLDSWMVWLFYFSFTLTPFIFNPHGFLYDRALSDFVGFRRWLFADAEEASWRAWWRIEMDARAEVWWHNKALILVRLLRFPIVAFGITSLISREEIYLSAVFLRRYARSDGDLFLWHSAFFISCGVLLIFMEEFKLVNPSANKGIAIAGISAICFALIAGLASGALLWTTLFESVAAFLIFLWGATRICLVLTGRSGIRHPVVSSIMRMYHYFFGCIIFFPVLLISAVTTSFHQIQTRILFNNRFVNIVDTGLIKRAEMQKTGRL